MDTDAAPPACVHCHATLWTAELAAGRWACERCELHAFQQLRGLPALFRRVNSLATLMKGSSGDHIGSPNREAPAPLKIGVLSLTANGGVVTTLQAIEDSWRMVRRRPMGPTRHCSDIDGAVEYLTINLRWACERYEEIGHDLTTIARLDRQLSGLDTGEPAHRTFPVPCTADQCGTQMRITLVTARTVCPGCGTRYNKTDIGRILAASNGQAAA